MTDRGENVHLAVLDGREALYIEKAHRSAARRGGDAAGRRATAYTPPASARPFSRTRRKELVAEVTFEQLKRYTAHTIVAPAQLRASCPRLRRTGLRRLPSRN